MLSPETVYTLYKEREKQLERELEWLRQAKEGAPNVILVQPWYSLAAQWLKARIFSRMPAKTYPAQQVHLDEPCVRIPC